MLSHYTNKDLIFINPQVKTKDELFEKMVNHLYNLDYVLSRKEFLKTLNQREELSSTELMPGIALPHARSDTVEKLFLSIVIFDEGLDYGNDRMGDAKIIFFFGTSNKYNKEYLQLLAKSARLLKSETFVRKLLEAKTPAQIIETLEEFDKDEEHSREPRHLYQLYITLHKTDRLNDLLSSLVEVGIANASVIEATSLSSHVSHDIPVFAGLYHTEQDKDKISYLITCHVEDMRTVYNLVKYLKESGIDFQKKGTGFLQVLEAEEIIGNHEENIEL